MWRTSSTDGFKPSALAAHRRQRPIHHVSGSPPIQVILRLRNKLLLRSSLHLLTHGAVAAFRLGPCSSDLHSSTLQPASAQSAPQALTNCLYPLQNAVAALHGYKGSSPPPTPTHPTSQPYFNPHYGSECVLLGASICAALTRLSLYPGRESSVPVVKYTPQKAVTAA